MKVLPLTFQNESPLCIGLDFLAFDQRHRIVLKLSGKSLHRCACYGLSGASEHHVPRKANIGCRVRPNDDRKLCDPHFSKRNNIILFAKSGIMTGNHIIRTRGKILGHRHIMMSLTKIWCCRTINRYFTHRTQCKCGCTIFWLQPPRIDLASFFHPITPRCWYDSHVHFLKVFVGDTHAWPRLCPKSFCNN